MTRVALVCLPLAVLACAPSQRELPPTIVFLSFDTLAARHTSLHGYARRTTPELEELAREAVVFERCLANAPWTSPSYASQLTGLLPESSWSAPDPERKRPEAAREPWRQWHVPPERETLAETLRARGYRTVAFVDNPMCAAAFGFEQGFERFDTSAAEIPADDPEGGFRHQVPLVLDWLAQHPDEPSFVFVNALDVHEPYRPAERVAGRFADDELARSPDEQPVGKNHRFGVIPERQAGTLVPEGELPERLRTAPLVQRYDAEVLDLDAALGEFVAALRARGLLEQLVLVVSADHGEAMGEPELKFGHGAQVEEVLHVPLVVRLPGGTSGGRRVAEPVELVDLFPTLCALSGAAAPAGLHGRSLVPLWTNATRAAQPIVHQGGRLQSRAVSDGEWRLVVTQPGYDLSGMLSCARARRWFAEHHPDLVDVLDARRGLREMLTLRPDLRQVLNEAHEALKGPFFELYHVADDPHQLVDRAAEHPEIVARLRQAYEVGDARAAEERARAPVRETVLDAAQAAELEALGYGGEER